VIVEKRTLKINDFMGYTKYMDYSKKGDDYYTDRPPGLSFASVPFYFIGIKNVTVVSVISGVLSVVMVYLITEQLINNPLIAFFVGLIFAFCTINWRYSTTFIIHPFSTFLVLLSVYSYINSYSLVLVGLILGLASIVEYTDFVYFIGVGLTEIILKGFLEVPYLGVGYLVGIFPLLIYNGVCFGSAFTTSYKYSAYFKWSNSPFTTFVTPIWRGASGLLFYIKKKNRFIIPGGVFTLSPVLIFGLIGFFYLPYEILILFLFLVLPLFLLISKHKTYWAGGGGDHRYISSLIPYLTIPIGLVLVNLNFLWPLVLIFSIVSFVIVILKMSVLTISVKDLKRINPSLKFGVKDIGKVGGLIFESLFIRKINLENCSHEIACRKIRERQM